MDKLEKMLQEDLTAQTEGDGPDIEMVLSGIHRKIKKRQRVRQIVYSAPVLILLLFVSLARLPSGDVAAYVPGTELILAGLESVSPVVLEEVSDPSVDTDLFEGGFNYLIDDHSISYSGELDVVMSPEDLQALQQYLEEV